MKFSKIAFCVLAALATKPVFSADFVEIYKAAQLQDPVFAAAQAAKLAGKEKLTQGRAGLLPNLAFSANSTFTDATIDYTGTTILPPGQKRYNTSGYGLTLTQPLFRMQNWEIYNQSGLQVAISEAQFKLAEQDLILRVAQAYFDVLMAQDTVQLADAQKKAISEQLEQAKRNFEVGTATVTDTYEAQARYDLIASQEIVARSNLEIKKQALRQITNTEITSLNALGKMFVLESPQPAEIQKWVDQAQRNNIQVEIAQAASELADREVARNFDGHLPTVDLVANYSNNASNGGSFGVGSETRSSSVGVQLNMPLYQGGASQSRWREADANREKSRQDLETARRNVSLQARQSYLGVENGISQVRALQQALKSSESLLESSKLGQTVGVRTNLDVLNAQQQVYSTQRDLLQAEYNYLISRLRLKASAGILSVEDVVSINQALN